MAKNLLIVESPAKAKTIEKYLGKDFKVQSSFGHIRDLDKGNKGVDVDNRFNPSYVVSPEKTKVVKNLKDWTKKVEEVWLATDEDREGEAISWHLCKVLGLDENTTKRIVFREITKPAILKAIEEPRTVDLNLVNAQQARRILDRLVGFDLSGLLWRKVKNKLSAGRVQSVAVKLLVEKEREIMAFASKNFFKVTAEFLSESSKELIIKAELKERFDTEEEAVAYLQDCLQSSYSVQSIEVMPTQRKPSAPFTTSTLQQDASRKLGFAVKRTMSVAQRLYERGLITYMRTDSISLSNTAMGAIADTIEEKYGEKYHQPRKYKTKKKDAQEAHEAIRPTFFDRPIKVDDRDMQRLYQLIWNRTVASQMSNAHIEKTNVSIAVSKRPNQPLSASGEVITFDGFLRLYEVSTDAKEEDKNQLPPLKQGESLSMQSMAATERFTRPPARYTEAGLVKKLEELGIGRPSTYAPTITKIMEEARGYVVKEPREGVEREYVALHITPDSADIGRQVKTEITGAVKNRLIPTDLGMVVTDFLDEHFQEVMDYSFTAEIEKEFDEIASGDGDWQDMIGEFYHPFRQDIKKVMEHADRATGERILGVDPESGRKLLVRMSRFGRPIAQIGAQDELEEGEKARFANLKPDQSIETIDFDEALQLFELPRSHGEHKGEELIVAQGRYGPYVKFGEKFVSIPRGEDPYSLSKDRCVELVEQKLKEDEPIGFYKELPMTKGKGRFGPFIKWNGLFANVSKKYDFDNLSLAEALEIVKIKEEKEANRYIKQWPEDKIALENGRWGPFIRFNKKSVKLPKLEGEKATQETAAKLTLEEVKAIIESELPGSFKKKTAAKKKPAAKKKAAPKKKSAAKKK